MFSTIKRLFTLLITVFVFYSCGSSSKTIYKTAYEPYKSVSGTVVDAESGQPVPDADVKIENTTLTTISDEEGNFNLNMPFGYFELAVHKEGYSSVLKNIYLPADQNSPKQFNLKIERRPDSYGNYESNSLFSNESEYTEAGSKRIAQLELMVDSLEQVVQGLRMKIDNTVANFEGGDQERFINYFIGNSSKCRVLNPEDLVFDENNDPTLVRLDEPVMLEVVNEDLGYKISVDLSEYVSKNYGEILGVEANAKYYFEVMQPDNEKQAEEWRKNREKHFTGSLRHFLISLSGDKSPFSYGYRLYSGTFVSKTSAMAYSSSSASDIEVVPDDILVPYTGEPSNILNFEGELRVEYIKRGVDDPQNIMGLDTYPYQTSWISLNQKLVEFTKSGIIEDPELIEVTGVWRYTPVCEMLPDDYLPGGAN